MDKVYLRLVELGSRTLEQVPEKHREQVRILLEESEKQKDEFIK